MTDVNTQSRILLVDDESDIVRTLQFRLQAAGFDVVTASNGAEALQKLNDQPIDLILSDFMMPEMNGIELTRTVKENPRWWDTKVLLFSCNGDPEFRKRAKDLGAIDYLPKSLGAGVLIDKICAQVEQTAAVEEKQPSEPKGEIVSLARSLSDMLHLARAAGALSEPALFALDSAQRVADDIVRLAEKGVAK